MTIRKLFEPNSVAVVGASRDSEKLGHKILKNLVEADFEGKIYPVNPKADEILGLTCYPSLEEAPKKTQLAVIVVSSEEVPSVLKECEENNVSNAVVVSGGFSEIGKEGKELEEEVVEVAEEMGIRILGPNCQGINNTSNGLCATWPLVTEEGPLSIVSESGTVGAELEHWAQRENIGISKFAVFGNKSDISAADLVDYFADDDETGIIALCLESIERGRDFLESARKAAQKKPVVVFKVGKSGVGAETVKSHTHSLPGDYEIFKSACKQSGLMLAESLEEFRTFCKGISMLPDPENNNTVVVSSSIGSGVLAADAVEDFGINLIDLPEKAVERLEGSLPSECIVKNPLCLTGSATPEMYDEAIKILARYKDVQNIVVIVGDPISGISDVIKERFDRVTMVPVMWGMGEEIEEKEKLIEAGVPVFSDPERAMKALGALFSSLA